MNENPMTCAGADAVLLDYFEGTLDARTRAEVDTHAASCLRCGSLIRDVNGIRENAVAIGDLTPSRNLWLEIESRIQPRVVTIGVVRHAPVMARWWMAAAAAALIVSTAGVTYVVTSGSPSPRVALAPAQPAGAASDPAAAAPAVAASDPGVPGDSSVSAAPALASRTVGSTAASSDLQLGNEISRLLVVVSERRAQLDPATVKIVEDNLRLIDAAVKQARAALVRDPASGFLTDQLNGVLEKKVELLRTAAMLPSRS